MESNSVDTICAMDAPGTPAHSPGPDPLQLVSDVIRLEIVLWEQVDTALRERHGLPLSFFESLHFIARAPGRSLRVGDLAGALAVTVGGASKLVDRIQAAGLIVRSADPDDRRAARVGLTPEGTRKLAAATETYRAEAARLLNRGLSRGEQAQLHTYVTRLTSAGMAEDPPGRP
jgi:DNA-binding MarR family transcriptional regulator